MTDSVPSLPDYDALARQLRAAGAGYGPAEAHGLLTGLLCAPGEAAALWRGLVLGEDEVAPALEPLADTLAGLLDETRVALDDPEFGFDPLLPGEDRPLAEQLEGFTDWCRGFLLGLSAGGMQERGLSAEAGEFLRDVVQMAEAEMEAEGADEEGETRALAELVEYLRAGVQLLYDERPAGRLH